MSTASIASGDSMNAGPRQGSGIGGLTVIAIPLVLVAICFAAKFGYITIPPGPRVGLIFALLMAMMLTGMPISIALGLSVLTFLFTLTAVPIDSVALKLFTGIEKFEIMAIPFFILAGNFLTHGGVAKRMINFAVSLIGHWHGGLALAAIVACAMFALVCGSSVATVVAIGSIILPEMVRAGYPMRFGAGVITVAGSLGILMLPSIPKVIYAISTNTSIGALFVAGVLPGSLLTIMLCAVTWWMAKKNGYPRVPTIGGRSSGAATVSALFGLWVSFLVGFLPLTIGFILGVVSDPVTTVVSLFTGDIKTYLLTTHRYVLAYPVVFLLACAVWLVFAAQIFPHRLRLGFLKNEGEKVWEAFWASIWGLMLVVIIIGGIYSGVFTATEAAAVSAIYAYIVSVYVYADMGNKDVPRVLVQSANMSAMLLYIITNAVLFSFVLTNENIPHALADWMLSMNLGPWGFLLVVNLLLLVAGNFMEPSSIILIMAPILFPAARRLGIDPVHFGILIDVNMEVGLCHLPVGLNLYVASGIAGLGITEMTKAVMPWLLTLLVFLVIVTYWPWLTLVVPQMLGMM